MLSVLVVLLMMMFLVIKKDGLSIVTSLLKLLVFLGLMILVLLTLGIYLKILVLCLL